MHIEQKTNITLDACVIRLNILYDNDNDDNKQIINNNNTQEETQYYN